MDRESVRPEPESKHLAREKSPICCFSGDAKIKFILFVLYSLRPAAGPALRQGNCTYNNVNRSTWNTNRFQNALIVIRRRGYPLPVNEILPVIIRWDLGEGQRTLAVIEEIRQISQRIRVRVAD